MVKLLLGLSEIPSPHDAADALAVAICHVHSARPDRLGVAQPPLTQATNWRRYRLARH